jgi:hypothetical protein
MEGLPMLPLFLLCLKEVGVIISLLMFYDLCLYLQLQLLLTTLLWPKLAATACNPESLTGVIASIGHRHVSMGKKQRNKIFQLPFIPTVALSDSALGIYLHCVFIPEFDKLKIQPLQFFFKNVIS